jgi:hypothetical protein
MHPGNPLAALEIAGRLEAMGVTIRSAELLEVADTLRTFEAGGGNRAMRRRFKRSFRRRGRGYTR